MCVHSCTLGMCIHICTLVCGYTAVPWNEPTQVYRGRVSKQLYPSHISTHLHPIVQLQSFTVACSETAVHWPFTYTDVSWHVATQLKLAMCLTAVSCPRGYTAELWRAPTLLYVAMCLHSLIWPCVYTAVHDHVTTQLYGGVCVHCCTMACAYAVAPWRVATQLSTAMRVSSIPWRRVYTSVRDHVYTPVRDHMSTQLFLTICLNSCPWPCVKQLLLACA
jgi:hypothetical protein